MKRTAIANRRSKNARDTATRENRQMRLTVDKMAGQQRRFFRRMGGTTATLSTGGGGVLALSTLGNTSLVSTTCADFASCANLYVAYRVIAMEVVVLPFFVANTTAVTVPVTIIVAPFMAATGFTTYAGAIDSSRSQVCSGYKSYKFTASNKGDNDAKLWTPTTAAIAGAEAYGLQCIGDATASTVSTPVWRVNVWYVVEFMLAA